MILFILGFSAGVVVTMVYVTLNEYFDHQGRS
jgi:capsular polysaccharide biosynthesis protein